MLCFASALRAAIKKPHSVTLTWKEPRVSPGVSIVCYNIYRSPASGGPFLRIAYRVPEPHYEDQQVASGRTYFYVVTAVDQGGHESGFSTETQAVIP